MTRRGIVVLALAVFVRVTAGMLMPDDDFTFPTRDHRATLGPSDSPSPAPSLAAYDPRPPHRPAWA